MGKRIIRIFKLDIEKQISDLIGIELNLILHNHQVYHGVIRKIKDKNIYFVDMIFKEHFFTLDQIYLIDYDLVSTY